MQKPTLLKSNPFMGMFLSKYSMLNALGYGSDSYVLPETLKILQRYKLKALIIHDPKTHPEFHSELTRLFEKFDYITGKDFLFFCLVDPPEKKGKFAERDYFGIWEPEELLNPINSYQSSDKSLTAYTLSKSLGIDFESLPAIVLTTDFQKKQFQYIKTSEEHLEFQLKEIGFFCSQKELINNFEDAEFKELIATVDLCKENELKILDVPLAKLLTNFISFIVANSRSNERSGAIKRCEKLIINFLEDKNPNQSLEKTDSESIIFLANLSAFHKDQSIKDSLNSDSVFEGGIVCESPIRPLPNKDDLMLIAIENESKIIYHTFNKIYPIYSHLIQNYRSEKEREVDYSPLAISLGKIFEIEINLSIVQWIRKYLNIEMPLYFNKHKPSSTEYKLSPANELTGNSWPVDFNKGYGHKWNAPGIGESELIMKSLYKQGDYPANQIRNFDQFLLKWESIRRYRNKAAHNNLMTEKDFIGMISDFEHLNHSKYFHDIVQLKTALKNSSNLL